MAIISCVIIRYFNKVLMNEENEMTGKSTYPFVQLCKVIGSKVLVRVVKWICVGG